MNIFHNQREPDVLTFSLSKAGPSFRLGRYFRLVEFACRDGSDLVLIHPSLITLLNELRAAVKKPITITSAYRTKSHNVSIGGADDSDHLYGMAADIVVLGLSAPMVQELLERWGIGGMGSYETFTHAGVRGKDRRWS